MEQSQIGTTIKIEMEEAATTTVYSVSEIELTLKQEPGLVQSMKSEPAVLVKKEIVENCSDDDSEQQCAEFALTPTGSGSLYEANGQSQCQWIDVKSELEEMDIGPTVLQHMDIHYALIKSTVDGCNEAMRRGRVKEEVEDKLRESLTPQKAMPKERIRVIRSRQHTIHKYHLASVCSVHVMRLDVFQCDLCHAFYTEKNKLLQHLQAMHGCRPETSLIVKLRKANRRTAADNKAASNSYDQSTTEVDYDEAHMKSHQRQQKDLQKNRTTSFKGFKCDSTFRKRHLLSDHNNLRQQNSRQVMAAKGTVARPSDQNGDERTKTKQKHSSVGLKKHKKQNGDLTKNIRVQTVKKPYQCKLSHSKFVSNSDLTKHVRVHTGEKPYQCKICDRNCGSNSALTKHVRVHTGEKPYQCTICDRNCGSNSALTKHVRVHTGEKPYQCTICDAKFAQSNGLTRHMRVHTGEKPCQCKICDARFTSSSDLVKHARVHTGEKPYQCQICDARFTQNGCLTDHMKIHTGEKPYQCEICGARFAYSTRLTQHVRVHTGEKPYQCKICNRNCASNSDLTKHVRVHTGEKPYQCKICDKRFARTGHLTGHMKIHTVKTCKICGARFAHSMTLTLHARVHTDKKLYH